MLGIRNNIKVATGLRSCYIYYSKEVGVVAFNASNLLSCLIYLFA